MPATYFDDRTLEFLTELTRNNNRAWFTRNRERYEQHVRGPALDFIRTMLPRVARISPQFIADDRKVGGSLMRVYRDTRFSSDKTPYKTNIGIQFRHNHGKDVHAPGLYVHLEPERAFFGVGTWRPASRELRLIRAHIADQPERWSSIVSKRSFRSKFEIRGESLKRPPRGFDPDHPLIEELKRKDFIVIGELDVAAAISANLPKLAEQYFKAGRDYAAFLCEALDVPF
jgi:uncharacterized protein (TIGR02453 family)